MAHVKRKYAECLNCGSRLSDSFSYCPQCGQANHDLNIPVRHLFEEAAEGIFHFDIKSLRTISTLTFKPGVITSEFIAGKRATYVAPVRLYIFISFLFFLLLSLSSAGHRAESPTDSPSTTTEITFYDINSKELRGLKPAQLDSVMQAHGMKRSFINRYFVRQLSRIEKEGTEGFNHRLMKGISYMMFAVMPLFALFVFLLYRKKAVYYIGTLVFSIHYHCFVFLLLSVSLIVDRLADLSLIWLVPLFICPVYLFLALRHMYGETRLRTWGKTLLVGVMQLISIFLSLLSMIFISVLTY